VLEVAWSRALSLSLGNTHQAVATVVASMMAGLCLGSLVAARALARLPRLPRAYAAVEMGIGAYAALTPLLFRSPGLEREFATGNTLARRTFWRSAASRP